jgi:ABC-type dipeptide/oligopeptide/nickel transport system permease component
MEQYNQSPAGKDQHLFELQIDQQSISYLGETARWAKFLSIVGFIMCGLMIVLALFAGTLMATLSRFRSNDALQSMAGMESAFPLIYIAIALLYFFPCLYLFNFAGKMQTALHDNDQTSLNASFGQLKSCFKFVGILTIIVLSFYILVAIVVISVATVVR